MNWRRERHAVAASTNQLALDRISAALACGESLHGLVIVAERQTAGRGQHGRTWESPPGGLYLSAVIDQVHESNRPRLSLLAGAAVAIALDRLGVGGAGIWWPNDIVIGEKKIAGILCESGALGGAWAGIIGVGINVETVLEDLPESLRTRATSLRAAGVELSVATVEEALLVALGELLDKPFSAVLRQVRKRNALAGKSILVRQGDQTLHAVANGIGEEGELLITVEGMTRPIRDGTLIEVEGRRLRD